MLKIIVELLKEMFVKRKKSPFFCRDMVVFVAGTRISSVESFKEGLISE
jgi:hypothetical protein